MFRFLFAGVFPNVFKKALVLLIFKSSSIEVARLIMDLFQFSQRFQKS